MSFGARAAVLFKYVVLFLVFGPPIGALAFFAGMGLYSFVQSGDISGLFWISLFGIIYAVPLSYLIGAVPAAVAGLIVGARAAMGTRPGFAFALVAGLVVGIGLVYAGGQRMVGQGADTVATGFLVWTCLAATVACWAIARGMIRHPVPSAPGQDKTA